MNEQDEYLKYLETIDPKIKAFHEKYKELFYIREDGDKYWFVPRYNVYFGDKFNQIIEDLKPLNGYYVSAGKNSHFECPITQLKATT